MRFFWQDSKPRSRFAGFLEAFLGMIYEMERLFWVGYVKCSQLVVHDACSRKAAFVTL
jgi:hypothetical protein